MKKPPYEFADERIWTDERLKERLASLGECALAANKHGERYEQISTEIDNVAFEMHSRNLFAIAVRE